MKNKNNLCVILDYKLIKTSNINILALARKMTAWGADILQLRMKDAPDGKIIDLAWKIKKITAKYKTLFIVNDRADIAYLTGADGVHLGKNDIPIHSARRILGRKKIIGATIHSLREMRDARNWPVDYLAMGPVFRTETKPGLKPLDKIQIKKMIANAQKTLFAIGGINMYNIESLCRLGINNIALCRAIIINKNRKKTLHDIKKCLQKHS